MGLLGLNKFWIFFSKRKSNKVFNFDFIKCRADTDMIPADEIIIRPPVEAYSILIPVTGGCSWNRCRFCNTYRVVQNNQEILKQAYTIRSLDDILYDITLMAGYQPDNPYIFLAGGNAFSVPTEILVSILTAIKLHFPNVQRISIYAKVLDILRKSEVELDQLAKAGLTICYIGVETGDDQLLHYMHKGQTARMVQTAIPKLLAQGIQASIYIILGLGGRRWSESHARETAKIINLTNPTYVRFRTLNVGPGSPLENDIHAGTFEILSPLEILQEELLIVANIDAAISSRLRHDHISNYVDISAENIGREKARILKELDALINDPQVKTWIHKGLKRM